MGNTAALSPASALNAYRHPPPWGIWAHSSHPASSGRAGIQLRPALTPGADSPGTQPAAGRLCHCSPASLGRGRPRPRCRHPGASLRMNYLEAVPPSPPAATVAAAAVRMKDSRGKASRAAAQPSRSAWRVPGASHGRGDNKARIWQLEGKRGGWGAHLGLYTPGGWEEAGRKDVLLDRGQVLFLDCKGWGVSSPTGMGTAFPP